MNPLQLPTWTYRQHDANHDLEVPAEGCGGWVRKTLPLNPECTAVVVMHAWDCGTREQFPGWHRTIEYIPRSQRICSEILPELLSAVRASPLPLFHIVGGGDYYRELPGYRRSVSLAGPTPPGPDKVISDSVLKSLREHRRVSVTGEHNLADIEEGFKRLDFASEARPLDDEGVAENAHQLSALCRDASINHLIYVGFAINWCLLLSPGGMAEMSTRGVMCSALRQAVTAVEVKESARGELWKELGLIRVAMAFGFVYDVPDFVAALQAGSAREDGCDSSD